MYHEGVYHGYIMIYGYIGEGEKEASDCICGVSLKG